MDKRGLDSVSSEYSLSCDDCAIMVPETDDGRVLFAIPWHNRVIVGTTDTPVDEINFEPRPMEEEIEFLLTHAARYIIKDPTSQDVLSMFTGLRPLTLKVLKSIPLRYPGIMFCISHDQVL